MLERDIRVTNALGLHARAAAQLVQLAVKFHSRITLRRLDTGVTADAKDILSILYLAAGLGVVIKVTADGADEKDAIDQIARLFADKFGED